MDFREWLLVSESIHIQGIGGESFLGRSRESGKGSEFSYASGEYWSTFSVRPYAEYKKGYVNISDAAATIVAIVKTTPIEPGNGADRAFIKYLTDSLGKKGRRPMAYREGENVWSNTIKNLEDFEDKQKMVQGLEGDKEQKTTQTPTMGQSSTGTTKMGGMSFSKESGSWAYIFRINPHTATDEIRKVTDIMKLAAKPMIDSEILDFYQLVNGNDYNNAEIVYSKRGRSEQENEVDFQKRASAYMKYLAEVMLKNYPKAQKAVIAYVDPGKKSNTTNAAKVPIADLKKYVQTYHYEDLYLNMFLDAVQKDDERLYRVLEAFAEFDDPETSIHFYKQLADDDFKHIVDSPFAYAMDALKIFKMTPQMEELARENFSRFKTQYEESLNDAIEKEGRKLGERDFDILKQLSDFIEIKEKDQIHDIHSKLSAQRDEEEKKQQKAREDENDMMERGRYMYMVAGETKWRHVPDKFIDGDDVMVGELAMEEGVVEDEEVRGAAHERARDEAMENAEERKSPNYGQDMEEVLSDLNYEIYDYIEDRFSDDEFEGLSDSESQEKVKDEYLDDFIKWKKRRLERDEEEESWRYEPEPEQSDIWKYEKEIAEDQAYESGLVIFKWPEENDEIDVWLHSKNLDKVKDMVRKSIQIGLKTKDEYGDSRIKRHTRVVFVFHDGNRVERRAAGDI